MSREYPDWFDPRKAAEGKRTFAGSVPLMRMERLRPLLAEADGEARFVAGFDLDAQGRVTIQIEVEASLPLICQRSLEPYLEAVHRQSLLGVIADMSEEALMPENYEPVIVQHGRLAMIDLVEDELLLGLPQVPRKPEPADKQLPAADGAMANAAPGKTRLQQPFADLAEQLKKHAQGAKSKAAKAGKKFQIEISDWE
jgi:uncharacterized protein